MITFSLSKDSAVRAHTGSTSVDAFPEKNEKTDASITLFSAPEETPTDGTISWPGEYERGGVAVRGIGHSEGGQVSYAVEMDGARCAFISSPIHDWTDHELELLGDVDVLVLPAGETKLAQKLIDEIDPRVLIPVQNGEKGLFDELLKVSGAKDTAAEKEFKLKGLPAEGRTVVVLK